MERDLSFQVDSISCHDIDELAERCKDFGWSLDFQQVERGAFTGEILVARLAGMQFARGTYNRGIHSQGDSPSGTISIAVPLTPPRSLHWQGYSLSSNHAILQKSSRAIDYFRWGHFPLAVASVDIGSLLHVAELMDKPWIESLVLDATSVIRPDARMIDRFRFHLQNLFALLEKNPQKALQALSPTEIRENFLLLFVDLLDSHQNRSTSLPSVRYSVVKRAEVLLLDKLDRPPTIPDLCKELYISERTLRYGFRECFGMSPAAYLKIHRLNGARKQLKASAGKEITVSDIALQWGFWHMSQFAKDYKELFGECPSETLRRSSSSGA